MTEKRKTAAGERRSFTRPGQPKINFSGLPYGAGSIQQRGRVWWMIYRGVEGRIIQESTHTEEMIEARRMLAVRALETARARVVALETIVNEAPQAEGKVDTRGRDAGGPAEQHARGGSIRNDAAQRRDGGKTNRGGKR